MPRDTPWHEIKAGRGLVVAFVPVVALSVQRSGRLLVELGRGCYLALWSCCRLAFINPSSNRIGSLL